MCRRQLRKGKSGKEQARGLALSRSDFPLLSSTLCRPRWHKESVISSFYLARKGSPVNRRQIWLTSLRSTVTEKLFSSSDTSDAFDPLWMPFTISTVLPENPFTRFASKHFVTSCENLHLSRFHRKINQYTFLQYIL